MDEKTKKKKIEEEFQRINGYFEKAPKSKREVLLHLIQNASFMKVTLEELQDLINKEGVIDEYQNGANQHGMKQSATLQSYNALVKNYASVMKALCALLPKDEPTGSKLEDFFERRSERTKKEEEEDRKRVEAETEEMIREIEKIKKD